MPKKEPWELTEYQSLEKATRFARSLGIPVRPVEPRPKGFVAAYIGDYIVAQPVDGGSVKQKRVVRKKHRRKARSSVPVPPLKDRIIGFRSFFVGSWSWLPCGEPLVTGEPLVEGEYKAYKVPNSDGSIVEYLKVGADYYSRITMPPTVWIDEKDRIDKMHNEWMAQFKGASRNDYQGDS